MLAITSARRDTALPDVPTVAEAGVPGYKAIQWHDVVVPARTSPAIVSQLNAELVKIVHDAEFTARLTSEASLPGERRRSSSGRTSGTRSRNGRRW